MQRRARLDSTRSVVPRKPTFVSYRSALDPLLPHAPARPRRIYYYTYMSYDVRT